MLDTREQRRISGAIIAIDGGGSKTDAVALGLDGSVLGRATGDGSSPHFIGVEASVRQIDALVGQVAGSMPVGSANLYLSGLDFPSEIATFTTAIAHLDWATGPTTIENDLYALLRAGTSAKDAVAVVCGSGINALGRRADGEIARFAALGNISGDWGGGTGIGEAALWNAARDADRRGGPTSLTGTIPGEFGLATIDELIHALHVGAIEYGDLGRLSPVVFAHADAGDAIAASIVERQGSEIAVMAASCILRLELEDAAVPVVLGGGVVASRNTRLLEAVDRELAARAPLAVLHPVSGRPIVGAALLALESAGASDDAIERARRELES
jgi:N-acetylglucosamine kinase-like BadF-type ATPase